MTLIAIIALCAGVLIVVLLAIAFLVPTDDESFDSASRRTPSPLSARRQVTMQASEQIPAPPETPRRAKPEARTTPASKLDRRIARHSNTEASTAAQRKLSHHLLSVRAWQRPRAPDAGWVVAGVALAIVVGYLITQT